MKRLFLALMIIGATWFACPWSEKSGVSVPVGTLLEDPQVGLDGLDDYRATLTISFQGTQAGKSVDSTDTYVQTEWPRQAAKFTSIDTTDDSGGRLVLLVGSVGEAQYFRAGSGMCTVDWGAAAGGPAEFRPASLLPAVGAARLTGEEDLDGIATRHYTFDAASLSLPEDVSADGEVWIANDGGYVVKYTLTIRGAETFFGPGVQGTRRVDYRVGEVGAHPEVVYPPGCEPVLTDMPAMDDASDLIRLPGLLSYSTDATAHEISAFYLDRLTAAGWQMDQDIDRGGDSSTWTFTRADPATTAFIVVETVDNSQRVTVMIPGQESSAAGPEATPGAEATALAGNPSVRVVNSFSILLGMDESQPGLPSYHLEAVHQAPVWEGGKVTQLRDVMSADVQGKDVHFTDRTTDPGGSTTTAEAYLIGDQQYDVKNGQVQPPGVSLTVLAWNLWPLDPVVILGTGATGAQAAGIEVLEGRTAEVYELNGTGSALSDGSGMGLPVTSVSGKVWVDQQTGALLKAELDYQADVKDADGNVKGSGSGRLEITVTKVGEVTVSLPK